MNHVNMETEVSNIMFTPDFSNTGYMYEEKLRDAERVRTQNQLIQSALAHRRAVGQPGLLSQLAQRLHIIKAQQADAHDSRRAHAV